MSIICLEEPGLFLSRCGGFLLENEVANNLMFGSARQAVRHPERTEAFFGAVLEEGPRVLGAALTTPPLPLLLAPWPEASLPELVDTLSSNAVAVEGVVAPLEIATPFVRAFCRRHPKMTYRVVKRIHLYRLEEVRFPAPLPEGRMRPAQSADIEVATTYTKRFYREVHDEQFDAEAVATAAISEQRLFLWETDRPVAMAAWVRDTPNTTAVALVYTPEDKRRKGYATALVAAVSQRALNCGKRYCVLFADCDNPTSNRIYQNIGYQPVEEAVHMVFEPLPL